MYVLEGGGHTEPGIHLIAGRRPKLDWPGGCGRGIRRAGTAGGSLGDPSSLRQPPGPSAPTCPPAFVTASASGPAGPGAGDRAPPACAGAVLLDAGLGVVTPPAADRAPEEWRGAWALGWRGEDAPPEPRPGQAPPRTPRAGPRPGGRAVPSGQLGKRLGERYLLRKAPESGVRSTKGPRVQVPRLLTSRASFPPLWEEGHAGGPLRSLHAENSLSVVGTLFANCLCSMPATLHSQNCTLFVFIYNRYRGKLY
ncbi:unnamed protein product [Rangifer tarandus platyrhynchus]|uniref:Uncharacterized protein n=2 Tax=Rangifer tarandus platyrhynchus TaxID=3082113 RepID=A0ACB0EVQ2_RANTA|nr:unnamed protein product [Rangifer tarandus platyrhynchus]CAI9704427.1 unnamed protein product [Rangifer tarandus platyrhynchus]